jgi:tyrosinase
MSQNQLASSAKSLINRLYGDGVVRKRDLKGRQEATEKTTRFFVKVQLDVADVERPCSVDLYVSGKRIGGMVVMRQPQEGIVHGEFSVDQAADTPQLLDSCSPTKLADSIIEGLQVEIVKVCSLLLS